MYLCRMHVKKRLSSDICRICSFLWHICCVSWHWRQRILYIKCYWSKNDMHYLSCSENTCALDSLHPVGRKAFLFFCFLCMRKTFFYVSKSCFYKDSFFLYLQSQNKSCFFTIKTFFYMMHRMIYFGLDTWHLLFDKLSHNDKAVSFF